MTLLIVFAWTSILLSGWALYLRGSVDGLTYAQEVAEEFAVRASGQIWRGPEPQFRTGWKEVAVSGGIMTLWLTVLTLGLLGYVK